MNTDSIYETEKRLSEIIRKTTLIKSNIYDKCNLYLKPENLQITGSFKFRGVYNKITKLTKSEADKGINLVLNQLCVCQKLNFDKFNGRRICIVCAVYNFNNCIHLNAYLYISWCIYDISINKKDRYSTRIKCISRNNICLLF